MAERRRSTSLGSSATQGPDPLAWSDQEAPLGPAARAALRRLARRASASWPIWIALALIVSATLTVRQARKPHIAEMTIVLRVTEGTSMRANGAELGPGALRNHINELAFSAKHLVALMGRHPNLFPDVDKEPKASIRDLWEQMDVSISDGSFIEDRDPDDPPRSARIQLTYHAPTPQLAAAITQELADLLIESTLEGQRADLKEHEAAASAAVSRAEIELGDLSRADPTGTDPRFEAAHARWSMADEEQAAVRLALRAASEHEALRFEVIDPGRATAPVTTTASLVTDFLLKLLTALVVFGALSGAFDPRVIDTADLTSLGVPFLGHVPALPAARGLQPPRGGTHRPRV